MHIVWILGAIFTAIYCFFSQEVLVPIFPALKSEGVWLVGLLSWTLALILYLLVCNIIEERRDRLGPPPQGGGHH